MEDGRLGHLGRVRCAVLRRQMRRRAAYAGKLLFSDGHCDNVRELRNIADTDMLRLITKELLPVHTVPVQRAVQNALSEASPILVVLKMRTFSP